MRKLSYINDFYITAKLYTEDEADVVKREVVPPNKFDAAKKQIDELTIGDWHEYLRTVDKILRQHGFEWIAK